MRSVRTLGARGRGRRRVLTATGLAAALALTATACNSGDDKASGPSSSSSRNGDDKIRISDAVRSKLKEHGIDVAQALYENMSKRYGGR
jgi:hypothetical protein